MATRIHSLIPTPLERAAGRFMRAPDHEEADNGLDNDGDAGEDDDQSGQSGDADDNDGDQDGDTDGSDPDDDVDSDGKPKNHRNGYEKRISKLTRRAKLAEEELARLRAERGEKPANQQEKKPSGDGKPKLDDFDTYEDYIEALADHIADKKINASKAQTEKEKQEVEFVKRFNAGKKAYKDWDDVVTDDVQISTAMQSAIKESDIPADILYYLGENPDEAERILELPAGKQALAIGKIEAKLEKSDSNKSGGDKDGNRQQSRAPDPIKPTSGNGGKLKKTYEEMSYGEFAAARARETRGGNRQRII